MRRQTVATALTNVAIAAMGFVTTAILSRWLGAEGRGELAAVLLWPTLLAFLLSLGVPDALVYFSSGGASPGGLLGSALILAGVQSVAAVSIGFLLLPIVLDGFGDDAVRLSRAFLLITPVVLVTQSLMSLLQGQLRLAAFNALRLIIPAGYLSATVGLRIAGSLGVGGVVGSIILLNLMALALVSIAYFRGEEGTPPDFGGGQVRELVAYGLRSHGAGIAGQLNLRLDQPIIALILSPAQLGLYVAAVSAANITQMMPQAVKLVVTPSIARIDSAIDRATALRSAFSAYWGLSLVGAAAMAIVLPVGIPLVYGREFSAVTLTAEILLAASVFLGAKTVLTGGVQALGEPWLASKAEILALPVSAVLLLLLVPWLGTEGAALASLATYGVALAFILHGLKARFGIPVRELFRVDPRSTATLVRQLAAILRPSAWAGARRGA